jgi:hypothetical protein
MKNVSILSLAFSAQVDGLGLCEDGILDLIRENLDGTEDVVILPETCLGEKISHPDDKFLSSLANLARGNNMYILIGLNKQITDTTHVNSAFLFDRTGGIAFCYEKMYPYWSEYDRKDSLLIPGRQATFADTDFGRVSATICFDANFPDLWQSIADLDVDLVFFTSAYSAGSQLSAHAKNHHYVIVTSTQKPDFAVYDIDGKEVTYSRHKHNQILISRTHIDVDRIICHHNFNRDKIFKMLREHPGKIELEHDYDREEWCVLRSISPEVSARELCSQYGIEKLRDYKRRSKKHSDSLRTKTK